MWAWVSKLVGYDEENAARAAAADAQLRELNAQDALIYGPSWQAQVETNYRAQESFDPDHQQDLIGEAFEQGASEGLETMQDAVKGTLSKVGLGALGFIPWWVWPAALIALFLYLGGGAWLRKKFAV